MKSKIVLIVLAWSTLLVAAPNNQFFNNIDMGVYSNSTNKASWTDPLTKQQFGTLGSYSFKFKRSGNYQPIFSVGAPSVKVGCSGFSIDGGFASLLDTKEIENQLKDSGQAFAWGAVMVLKTSLPIVSQVFEAIQGWARMIQDLMQNACQMGNQLAKMGIEKLEIDTGIEDWGKRENDPSTLKTILDSSKSSSQFIKTWLENDKTDGKELGSTENSNANAKVFYSAEGVSVLSYYFGEFRNSEVKDPKYLIDSDLGSFLTQSDSTFGQVFKNGSDAWGEKASDYLLMRLFYGDFATSSVTIGQVIQDHVNPSNGNIDSSVVAMNALKRMEETAEGSIASAATEPRKITITFLPPVIKAEMVFSSLMYGFSDNSAINGCSTANHECSIPNNFVYYKVITPKGEKNDTEKHHYVLMMSKNVSSADAPKIQWQGFLAVSKKGVYDAVKNSVEPNLPAGKAYNGSSNISQSDLPSSNNFEMQVYIPDVSRYIKLIVKLEIRGGGETPQTLVLKNTLAKLNAYSATTALLMSLKNQLESAMSVSTSTAGENDMKKFELMMKNIKEVNNEIFASLGKEEQILAPTVMIKDTFREIEKELKEAHLKMITQ